MFKIFEKTIPIGVNISDSSIEVVRLNEVKEITLYKRTLLPKGLIEGGSITEKEKLAEELKKLLSDAFLQTGDTDIKKKIPAIFSIPDSKAFVRLFEVPEDFNGPALRNHIRDTAFKSIPIPEREVYWDFTSLHGKNIPSLPAERKKKIVLFAGTSKTVLNSLMEVGVAAGVSPAGFDIEALALARALFPSEYFEYLKKEHGERAAVMILDIGGRNANASIWSGQGVLHHSIEIPIGGDHVVESIMQKFSISAQEANTRIHAVGFNYTKNDENEVIVLQLQSGFQRILKEVKEAIAYYEKKSGEKVAEIILAGGSSGFPQVNDYFGVNLGKRVRAGDPFQHVEAGELVKEGVGAILYVHSIGLALAAFESENTIDLLRAERGEDEKRKSKERTSQNISQNSGEGRFVFIREYILPHKLLLLSLLVAGGVSLAAHIFYTKVIVGSLQYEAEPTSLGVATSSSEQSENAIATSTENKIRIKETETGWLNVREGAGREFPQVKRITPGETFTLLEEKGEWYKIKLSDEEEGWISAEYAEKI